MISATLQVCGHTGSIGTLTAGLYSYPVASLDSHLELNQGGQWDIFVHPGLRLYQGFGMLLLDQNWGNM